MTAGVVGRIVQYCWAGQIESGEVVAAQRLGAAWFLLVQRSDGRLHDVPVGPDVVVVVESTSTSPPMPLMPPKIPRRGRPRRAS